jgi:hypothetical protein
MKLYINSISSYRSDLETIDIKKELKETFKHDTRRQDLFIQLALLGAYRLKKESVIDQSDEVYVTSGLGNTDVISRLSNYVVKQGNSIKPFDFINVLGNATSYYITKALGTKGKALFQISDRFTYLRTLIFAYASISLSGNHAVISSCDLATQPEAAIKQVMGVDQETQIISSVNYQRVTTEQKDAIAEIEFESHLYSLEEVLHRVNNSNLKVIASARCKALGLSTPDVFFETMMSAVVNEAIQKQQDVMFIDCLDDRYAMLIIKSHR